MGETAVRVLLACCLLFAGCDVPILRPTETGIGDAGTLSSGACHANLVVAATDSVQSANIGIMDSDGSVLSYSVLSSGSVKAGFSTALGGDLAFPSGAASSTEIAVLDRYPGSVITWLDASNARVRAQLSVSTGFAANPHDYVPVAADKAFVTRFDSNPLPGRVPFDGGGDLLVVNPQTAEIQRRIDLSTVLTPVGEHFAHPDRARLIQGLVYVVVPFYDARHRSGASYLAVLDPHSEQVTETLQLQGVTGCSGMDVAPDGESVAVACSGSWQGTTRSQADSSAIVGVAITPRLREIWRVSPSSATRAFGFALAFADSTHVLVTKLGDLGPPVVNDAVQLVEIRQGQATTLFESAGKPASLSLGPCLVHCRQCFIADASRSQVVRLELSPNGAHALTPFTWLDPVGLPPRELTLLGPSPAASAY